MGKCRFSGVNQALKQGTLEKKKKKLEIMCSPQHPEESQGQSGLGRTRRGVCHPPI